MNISSYSTLSFYNKDSPIFMVNNVKGFSLQSFPEKYNPLAIEISAGTKDLKTLDLRRTKVYCPLGL